MPNAADVIGIANAQATVTVNGASTYRKGEYYQKAVSIDNSVTNVWQVISNYASLTGTNQTNLGYVFLPKTPETFGYDLDGNQTNDGRWFFTWDGENRLVSMVSSNVADGAKRKLNFVYDAKARRVQKTSFTWVAGAWQTNTDVKFVYDDWNLLAELNATNNTAVRSFLWGLDLSGSMQGAGGVGGLVAINSTGNGVHFAAYDGNGNVVGLVNATNGSTSAQYEYGPFGEIIRSSGTMSILNPYRFSTKYTDDESDLVYYGMRLFQPATGRWLSRDPLEEAAGVNLYSVVGNDPIARIDLLGLLGSSRGSLVSEANDLKLVQEKLAEWQKAQYTFAINVMTHFLSKNGPRDYNGTEKEAELIKTSDGYRSAAQKSLAAKAKELCKAGKDKVQEISSGKKRGPYAFDLQYYSGDLLNALGGARFYYTAQICLDCKKDNWAAEVSMTQEDFYTFERTGPFGYRMAIPSYAAAHELQVVFGYKAFYNVEHWADHFESE